MKLFKIEIFDKKLNRIISTTSDCIFIIYDSLESPYQSASNRIIIMSLASMDRKTSTFYCLIEFANNSLSIRAKDIKTVRLDAA